MARIIIDSQAALIIGGNGGTGLQKRQTTREWLKMTFVTNHLGHFAFDAQVWPAVPRSAAPRWPRSAPRPQPCRSSSTI